MALRHVSLKQPILWTGKKGQKKCVLLCYIIIILDQKIKQNLAWTDCKEAYGLT